MDLGTTFDIKEIIAGLIGAAGIYAYARKKYSFDKETFIKQYENEVKNEGNNN